MLAVSESIMKERVVLAPSEEGVEEVRGLTEAQAVLTQPDQMLAIERTVLTWLKQIGKSVNLSIFLQKKIIFQRTVLNEI